MTCVLFLNLFHMIESVKSNNERSYFCLLMATINVLIILPCNYCIIPNFQSFLYGRFIHVYSWNIADTAKNTKINQSINQSIRVSCIRSSINSLIWILQYLACAFIYELFTVVYIYWTISPPPHSNSNSSDFKVNSATFEFLHVTW